MSKRHQNNSVPKNTSKKNTKIPKINHTEEIQVLPPELRRRILQNEKELQLIIPPFQAKQWPNTGTLVYSIPVNSFYNRDIHKAIKSSQHIFSEKILNKADLSHFKPPRYRLVLKPDLHYLIGILPEVWQIIFKPSNIPKLMDINNNNEDIKNELFKLESKIYDFINEHWPNDVLKTGSTYIVDGFFKNLNAAFDRKPSVIRVLAAVLHIVEGFSVFVRDLGLFDVLHTLRAALPHPQVANNVYNPDEELGFITLHQGTRFRTKKPSNISNTDLLAAAAPLVRHLRQQIRNSPLTENNRSDYKSILSGIKTNGQRFQQALQWYNEVFADNHQEERVLCAMTKKDVDILMKGIRPARAGSYPPDPPSRADESAADSIKLKLFSFPPVCNAHTS